MTLINFQIIYNWSNEKSDTQAQKQICLHLEKQLSDFTSKTLHSDNNKSKDTTVQGLHRILMMPVSIFKDIL